MIFASPRLVWPVNSEPYFLLNLQQPLTGIARNKYQVLVDEELKGVLFPEQSGALTLLYPIKLDCNKPIVKVEVISESGNELFNHDIALWDTTRSISIYNQDGLLLTKSNSYKEKMSFYAIVDSGTEIPVSGQRVFDINREWFLHHLNGQEISQLESLLGRGFLWLDDELTDVRNPDSERNRNNELPFNIRQVTIYPDRDVIPRLGEAISFTISVPGQSCQVIKIIYGDKNITFNQNGFRYVTVPVAIRELKPLFKINILYNGREMYCLEKRPKIKWRGASLIKSKEKVVLTKQCIIEQKELINNPLQVHLPANWRQKENRQKLCLMEGYQILEEVKTSPQLLKNVGGFGAPLILKRPYNSQDRLVIAGEVQNRGMIREIYYDARLKKTLIKFKCAYELGEEHQVFIWDSTCTLREVPGNCIEQSKDNDSWYISFEISPDIAVMVAYRGLRVGTWWGERFFPTLLGSSRIVSPTAIAALLRWGRFPIVSSQLYSFVQRLLQTHPTDVIAAWILDEGLPEGLKHAMVSEGEKAALRYYLLDLRVGNMLNQLMISRYFTRPTKQTIDEIIKYLGWCRVKINDVSPLLYADLVRRIVRRIKADLGVIAARDMVHRLELEILQLKNPGKINEEREKLGELAAKEANVDYFFIKNGIVRRALDWIYQRPLGNWSRPNILAACSFPYLRKYLCVSLINAAYN